MKHKELLGNQYNDWSGFMELQQLRYFISVAKHQNISRAALELNISQPSLSRAIKALEESEGMIFFERYGNKIKLNEYGEILLNRATEMLELEEKTRQELQKYNNTPVRLIVRCIENILPTIIKEFDKKYPDIRISILQNDDIAIIERRFDLMISGNMIYLSDYNYVNLLKERLLCAIPVNHPFAKKGFISIEEFAALPQILFGGNRYIQYTISEYIQSLGLKLRPSIICDDVRTACNLVMLDFGVLILPEYALDLEIKNKITLLPLQGFEVSRDIYLFWNKNNYLSLNAKALRNVILRLQKEGKLYPY